MEHTSLFWASFTVANYPAEAFLFTRWFKGSFAEDWCKLLICWKIDFSGKFATVQQTIFSNSLHTIFFFFPLHPIFPQNAGWETTRWWKQVIAISLSLGSLSCSPGYFFSLSMQACAQHCLQIRHLGDEWNLLPKSCDVLDFLRSEQLLQLPFHSLLSWKPFSLCSQYSLSPSLSSPLRLSGYHLQFNAYLGWALTKASPWNGPGPACMPNEVDVELFRSLSLYNIYLMQLHGSGLLERLKILLSLYKSHSIPPSTTY